MRRIGYQNAVLTGIALVLAVGLLDRGAPGGLTEPATAAAQPEVGGLSNALEQRKQMISELRTLNSKLDRIEAALSKGLNVKVTEMPPLKFQPEPRGRAGQGGDENAAAPTPAGPKPASTSAGADGK
jgi:hypothetical protein